MFSHVPCGLNVVQLFAKYWPVATFLCNSSCQGLAVLRFTDLLFLFFLSLILIDSCLIVWAVKRKLKGVHLYIFLTCTVFPDLSPLFTSGALVSEIHHIFGKYLFEILRLFEFQNLWLKNCLVFMVKRKVRFCWRIAMLKTLK